MALPLTLPPIPLLLEILEFVTPSHSLVITLSLPSYLVNHVSVAQGPRRGHNVVLRCIRSDIGQLLLLHLP